MSLLDHVIALLEREGLDCVILEEGVALRTLTAGSHGEWTSTVEIASLSDAISALVIFSRPTDVTPGEQRGEVIRLLNRVNAEAMAVGNFELDADGVIARAGIVFEDPAEVSAATIEHTLQLNWAELDHYLPAIEAVCDGAEADATFDALMSES